VLLTAPYLLTASICTNLIAGGAAGRLNLLVLLFIRGAMKFLMMGPVSVVLVIRVRTREAVVRQRSRKLVDAGNATLSSYEKVPTPVSGSGPIK
jgi:hypothetical protein